MPYLRVKNELPLIPGYSEGAIAYAPDAADAPLNECICYINPVQIGRGDPSPSNVRPITGHTDLNLVQKDGNDTVVHTYTTALGTTVYGGTLDVVSGVMTITKGYKKLDANATWLNSPSWGKTSTNVFYTEDVYPDIRFNSYSDDSMKMCNFFPVGTRDDVWAADENIIGLSGTPNNPEITVRVDKSLCPNTNSFISFITNNDIFICYELATPQVIQLTPQEVKSLLGSNDFYHDCNGDTKITYIRRLDS